MTSTTTDPTTKKLLASLRNHAPSKVRAYAGDDDWRDIAVPTRRKKWAQVIEAVEARAWTRVELLDKSGAVLGYVDNVEPATAIEELSLSPSTASKLRSDSEWIVALALRTGHAMLTSRDAEMVAVLRAQGDVMRELVNGMSGLTSIYAAQRDAASEVAAMQATAAAGSGDGSVNVKELLDAAPTILAAIPMLRQLLSGGSHSNGASKAKE